ncbi:MAG TPA: N,N-dimethylformamidase beta subunit family domain-containing protein, partial [Streptosporangiaceae bacterium]
MTKSYAWPLTVRDELKLHVSTELPQFQVRLFRFGATVEEVSGPAGSFDGFNLPLGRPDEAWGWPQYSIELDAGLTDGIYIAVPVGPDDPPIEAGLALTTRPDASLFILKRQCSQKTGTAEILVKLPTATYAAYNQIGGASTYAGAYWVRDWAAQGYVASLQRPGNGGVGGRVMEGDAPDVYARESRRQEFGHWDAPFVAWLESRYQVSYCTDFDLEYDDSLLDGSVANGPGLLLSAGHDEYWSANMRRKVLEFVDRGGSMCFFAGDVACFKIEYSASGDRLFCPKMAGEAPEVASRLTGALWHVHDPQHWLTMNTGAYGGGWWDGRRAIDAYQPVVPDHWIFGGVQIPAAGISGGPDTPIIGYETDGVRLERDAPYQQTPRLSEHRKGGSGGRTLLAVAKLSPGWVAGYDQANAAIVIRTAQSGGMVFSTGTTDWPLGLGDAAVSQITANVIDRLSCRPLRIRGPVCGEGEYIGEGELIG